MEDGLGLAREYGRMNPSSIRIFVLATLFLPGHEQPPADECHDEHCSGHSGREFNRTEVLAHRQAPSRRLVGLALAARHLWRD
jgi:hypothetical protein